MNQAQLPYVALYLLSTFLASVSQVLLKKAALREHKSLLAEYTDWRVVLGYGLFVGCSLLTISGPLTEGGSRSSYNHSGWRSRWLRRLG